MCWWQAIAWIAGTSEEHRIQERERILVALEAADRRQKASGASERWAGGSRFEGNGLLFEHLLRETGYDDVACTDTLREGAKFLDVLDRCGQGDEVRAASAHDANSLWESRKISNEQLIGSLKEQTEVVGANTGTVAEALLATTEQEASMGRVAKPRVLVDNEVPDDVLLHPRFGILQEKEDGTVKVRPIDNFSWSRFGFRRGALRKAHSVNGHTYPVDKVKHQNLDEFTALLQHFQQQTGCQPHLFKTDIDAAFRRVPIRDDHTWAAGFAFRARGKVCRTSLLVLSFAYVLRRSTCRSTSVAPLERLVPSSRGNV